MPLYQDDHELIADHKDTRGRQGAQHLGLVLGGSHPSDDDGLAIHVGISLAALQNHNANGGV